MTDSSNDDAAIGGALQSAWREREALFSQDPADEVGTGEAARAIGISADQLQAAINAGRISHRIVDGQTKITIGAVRAFREELLRQHKTGADAVAELSNELDFYE